MDCIKQQKRKIKIISIVLAVSLLVNLILAVMLCARLTHKAADVKQTTAATACADCSNYDVYKINTTDIIRGRLPWNQTILTPNTACRKCRNSNLRSLLGNSYFPTRKRRYLPIFMYRNYPCGRWETVTGILRAV